MNVPGENLASLRSAPVVGSSGRHTQLSDIMYIIPSRWEQDLDDRLRHVAMALCPDKAQRCVVVELRVPNQDHS